jgi:hypothetical protein
MGAGNEMYMTGGDHQTTYQPMGERPMTQPTPDAFAGGNFDFQALNTSDAKEAEKEASMYSYSRVSQNLRDDS